MAVTKHGIIDRFHTETLFNGLGFNSESLAEHIQTDFNRVGMASSAGSALSMGDKKRIDYKIVKMKDRRQNHGSRQSIHS